MKIELGKTYKTRDGRKARVICVDRRCGDFPIVGLISDESGEEVTSFKQNGRYFAYGDGDGDLIEEWREPLEVWGVVSYADSFYAYENKASAEVAAKAAGRGWRAAKFVEVAE